MLPVGESEVLCHGDREDIPPGVDSRLLNRSDDLHGLPDADADLPLLVADDYNGSGM